MLKKYKAVLAATIVVSLLVHLLILWNSMSFIASGHADFAIFYTGAQILKTGSGVDLYDPAVQKIYQEKFAAPWEEWNLPFNHAPFELLVFLPLAYFSYPVAYWIWAIVNVVLLVSAYRALVPFLDPHHKLLLGALLLASYPTMVTLQMGQDSILTLLIVIGVFVGLKRHHDVTAGILLAAGLYKPQLILPMAGIFVIERRWRGALAFVLMTIFLIGISLALVGWQGAAKYLLLLRQQDYVIYPQNMTNIRGLVQISLGNYLSKAEVALLSITASGVIYSWCLYACRPRSAQFNSRLDLKFSLMCVTAVLVSYHLYAHDLILLIVPIMLLLSYVFEGQARIVLVRFLVLALVFIFTLPLLPSIASASKQLAWGTLFVLLFFLAIALELSFLGQRAT